MGDPDGPYDFARERHEARDEACVGTRRIGGQVFDEADVPSSAELAEDDR